MSDIDLQLAYLAEPDDGPVATTTIVALNRALARAGVPAAHHRRSSQVAKLARLVGKLRLQRRLVRRPRRTYIVALMWPNDGRAFPYGYFGEIVPYIFDCWPYDWDKWASLFKRHRIHTAFFSARGAAEHFAKSLPQMSSHWLPEACDPGDYHRGPELAERSIAVLELGRRLPAFHDPVQRYLADAGLNHVYKRAEPGPHVFADLAALAEGLANSKVYACFPKSVTHPGSGGTSHRSGGLETVTLRYFEGMASRCILVGHCPKELEDLFGYNPVVQYDEEDPGGQIGQILSSIDTYQSAVDRNYDRLMEVGTWDHRVASMLEAIGHRPTA